MRLRPRPAMLLFPAGHVPFRLAKRAQSLSTRASSACPTSDSYNANTAKCLSAILRPVGTGGIPLRRHSSNASNCPGAASAADTCHSSPASPRSPRFGGPPSPSPSTEFRLDLEMGWSLPRSESLGSANDPAADEDIGSELAALNAQLGDMALAPERRDELTMQAAALRLQLEEIMLTPRIGRARFGPDVVHTSTSRLVTRRSSENLGMDREHLVHEVLQANQTKLEELVARVGSRQPAEPAAALTSGPQAQGLSSVSQYQFGQHGIVPQYYQHPPDMPIWGAASTAWAEPLPGPTGLLTAEDAHRLTQPVVPEFPVAAQSAGVRQEAEHTPERYSKLKRIGGGAFSNIWMGFDRKNCVNVAVKVIDKVAQFPSAADSEFAISQSLDHHHVLKCLGRYQVNCQEHLIFQLCNEVIFYRDCWTVLACYLRAPVSSCHVWAAIRGVLYFALWPCRLLIGPSKLCPNRGFFKGDLFDRLESSEYDQDEEQCKLYIQQAADGMLWAGPDLDRFLGSSCAVPKRAPIRALFEDPALLIACYVAIFLLLFPSFWQASSTCTIATSCTLMSSSRTCCSTTTSSRSVTSGCPGATAASGSASPTAPARTCRPS